MTNRCDSLRHVRLVFNQSPAQASNGTDYSVAGFADHAFVNVQGIVNAFKLYGPSYGYKYTGQSKVATETVWQDASLEGDRHPTVAAVEDVVATAFEDRPGGTGHE